MRALCMITRVRLKIAQMPLHVCISRQQGKDDNSTWMSNEDTPRVQISWGF